jgi:small-conductance mechanosensitive channel
MFLSPSFVGAIATSATALLSLSFMFATTCQEVLGSCVFLFVKHPYDVGDRVIIDHTEYLVYSVALLYTVFTRQDNQRNVQSPNVVLNGLWIENLTRSKVYTLSMPLLVPSSTPVRELEKDLRDHMKELDQQCTINLCNIGFLDTKTIQLTCDVIFEDLQSTSSTYATASLHILEKLQGLGTYKD